MSDLLRPIENLPDISFIDNMTLEKLLGEMINDYLIKYEELTGKKITLGKADPNRLILYACALQIYQGYQFIDRTGKQNLLKYSYGDFLENLAALKGITRNQAQPAKVTVRFTLSEVRTSAIPIPEGTRVAAGEVYFEAREYNEISPGDTDIDIEMICTQDGEIGNGFIAGEITTLVDPIGYIESVENITVSAGGSEIETDENFAERIFLAPSSYSTAGPDEAYKYWAKTYHQDIADVEVTSPGASEIDIRIILQDGAIPDSTILQGLENFFKDKQIKPLTDLVTVSAPDIVEYSIEATYYINKSNTSNANTIQANVEEAVRNYIEWQNTRIGRDINPSELIRMMMAAGAKRVELTNPIFTAITNTSIAKLTSQTIAYGGIEDD